MPTKLLLLTAFVDSELAEEAIAALNGAVKPYARLVPPVGVTTQDLTPEQLGEMQELVEKLKYIVLGHQTDS